MFLSTVLDAMAFNEQYERFYNLHGDNLDTEDVQDMAKDLTGIWTPADLNKVNACDSVDEAFYFIDMEAQSMEEEALKEFGALQGVTQRVFKILVFARYSLNNCWYDDWDTLESRIIEYLPNYLQKNWGEVFRDFVEVRTERGNFEDLLEVVAKRFLFLLWNDLQGQEITFLEKMRLLEAYREEYEPDLTPKDCYGKEWQLFEGLLSCRTYGELLQGFADRENHFWEDFRMAEEGESYREEQFQDYLYLLSPWVSFACTWGGCEW